jgi:two-component sensor histidine kinase
MPALPPAFLECVHTATSEASLLGELATVWQSLTKADSVDLLMIDASEKLVLAASTHAPDFVGRIKLGKGKGVAQRIRDHASPIYLEDGAKKHPDYVVVESLDDHKVEAIAGLPLVAWNKDILGVALLNRYSPWSMSEDDRVALQDTASQLADLIWTYRAAFQHGSESNRLGALSEVTRLMADSPYLEEILQLLVSLTAQQFGYRVVTVRLLDDSRKELVLRATQAPARAYQRKRAIKLGESIAGRAIGERSPVIVPDVQLEADYIGHDLAAEQGLRSMICVPLIIQERPVGVMSCYTTELHEFTEAEVSALQTLAQQAAISIEHAKLQVRTTLLQEMHHRVKNNLQQIASLIRLQMRHPGEKTLAEALNDTQARILSISAVHDLLSRDDLDHVSILSIAESLVQLQQSSLLRPDRRIQFLVRGDAVYLSTAQATQVALALNELILNAAEHGFARTESGDIHITVEDMDEEVGVWVSNKGDSLPPDFDLSKYGNLGLQIVDSLARSLGGRFVLEDRLGWTVAEIQFPRASGE